MAVMPAPDVMTPTPSPAMVAPPVTMRMTVKSAAAAETVAIHHNMPMASLSRCGGNNRASKQSSQCRDHDNLCGLHFIPPDIQIRSISVEGDTASS